MFSSNQIFEVSGDLTDQKQLVNSLEFALKYSGYDSYMRSHEIAKGKKLLYQITEDGKYCIGWGDKDIPDGWKEFPFEFSISIVSLIIKQHLEKFPIQEEGWDGSYKKGFVMKYIENSFSDMENGIKKPCYGIVYFKPYTCFYHK